MKLNNSGRELSTMDSVDSMSEYKTRGLIEILGPDGVAPFRQQVEKEQVDAVVHGVMIRAGRAGFQYWLRQEGDTLEKVDPDFNLSPVRKKITTGLAQICGVFTSSNRYNTVVKNDAESWELDFSGTDGAHVSPLECGFISGFVQEFASWAGMGRLYQVRAKTGAGSHPDHCTIIIKKEPVE